MFIMRYIDKSKMQKSVGKADEIGMINNHTELCGYYVIISPDKINGAYIDKIENVQGMKSSSIKMSNAS